jgi:hypothetical protein
VSAADKTVLHINRIKVKINLFIKK